MDREMVSVGEIENLANWVHRILPIQSLRQLVDLVVIVALLSLGFFALFRIAPPGAVVVGMLLGICPSLAGVLPTRFQIDVGGNVLMKRELMENLEAAAFRFGYKQRAVVDGVVTMKPKLPKVLVWDENTVRLQEQQTAIVISGPMLTTSVLRRKILKQLNLE
jgi:hypothetical protein